MNRNQKIAAALGLSLAQVGLLLHAPASPRASTPVPGADLWREERPSPLSEFVGDPSHIPEDLAVETLSAEAALRSLARSLTTLPARQRVVLAARYGLGGRRPETLQDLADKLGISREGVRQLQSRAEVTLARCRSLSRAS
jgi:DNA-directed RNA polymerase sigma subunit (sigma70/sigma32)